MNQKKRKKRKKRAAKWRGFFTAVARVLKISFAFPPESRGSNLAILAPKNPETPELYVSLKPFSEASEPPSLEEAEARFEWNSRRVKDWYARGGGAIWEEIQEQVRSNRYERHAHTYRHNVRSVMGSAAREMAFLSQWIAKAHRAERARQREARRRRKSERPAGRSERRPPPSRATRAFPSKGGRRRGGRRSQNFR